MKKLVLTALILAVGAVQALAVGSGAVGVYADNGALSCNIADAAPGLVHVWIVHTNATDGASASEFQLTWDAGMTMSWLADTSQLGLTIGTSKDGISCAYGGCISGTFPVLDVSFFAAGTSANCSYFHLVPDPTVTPPLICTVSCNYDILDMNPGPGEGVVNSQPSCNCDVAVHQATWGSIKALYK